MSKSARPLPVHILNGPNLNLLGSREPAIYGTDTLADIESQCRAKAADVVFRQSNREGELIEWIHDAGRESGGIILNAGGYSHSSVSIHDALLSVSVPVVEVHLSNLFRRESFRHRSFVAMAANGVIVGFGATGYLLALDAIAALNAKK